MSWEYEEYKKPCPCGKGMILVRFGSNDWGQTSCSETILCPDCRKKEEQRISLKQERERIANEKVAGFLEYFNKNYSDTLKNKFLNAKSQKDIWLIAKNLGIESHSLSSFYKHSKCYDSLDKYIDSLIYWSGDRMGKLIKALEIDDKVLNELNQEAYSHNKEFEDESYTYAYLHAKGKI